MTVCLFPPVRRSGGFWGQRGRYSAMCQARQAHVRCVPRPAALAEVFGCTVSHAPTIMHGKTSLVEHIDDEIFAGVANPMTATRYHRWPSSPTPCPMTWS